MAEDRLNFPDFQQGSYHHKERLDINNTKPHYHKYGGREATAIALEEGGIGGKWMVKVIIDIYIQTQFLNDRQLNNRQK